MQMTIEVYGVDLVVDFDGTEFVPAKISGPPEDCYPAEGGEADINAVYLDGTEVTQLLAEHVFLKIGEKLTEYLCSGASREDNEADAAEAREACREYEYD